MLLDSKPAIVTQKCVIGIATRTSNENFYAKAGPLWLRLGQEKVSEQIPNKLNRNLLALYTDYEGDYTQDYTYVLGYEVADLNEIPPGMVGIVVPQGPYALFEAVGAFPQSMIDLWQGIWASDFPRAYQTDFEDYGPDFSPEAGKPISVYIGVPEHHHD